MRAFAQLHGARILTFGRGPGADVRVAEEVHAAAGGTLLSVRLPDAELTFTLGQPGAHWVSNALAVLAAVYAVGGDLAGAGLALAELPGLPGRGARRTVAVEDGTAILIDESYNANPASMAATLGQLGLERGRRVALLGEMRELGEQSPRYHAELAEHVRAAGVSVAILVGAEMAALAERLEGSVETRHVADASAAQESLASLIAPGDVILIKGSNAIGLGAVVEALASGRVAIGNMPCSI